MAELVRQNAVRIGIVCLGAAISIFGYSRVENLGPQDMVQVDTGDIHRHDFVRRWGWPSASFEQFTANWYVYRPSGVVRATPDQIAVWGRESIRRLEQRPRTREQDEQYERFRASVDGNFWRVNSWNLIAVLVSWALIVQALVVIRRRAIRISQSRRVRAGQCIICGYDVRASPERCPECGTKVPSIV